MAKREINRSLRENWIASGVKFIAACDVLSYTGLILIAPGSIIIRKAYSL